MIKKAVGRNMPAALIIYLAVVIVIPLQMLAHHIARLRDLEVDQPRNLAKSVTVE